MAATSPASGYTDAQRHFVELNAADRFSGSGLQSLTHLLFVTTTLPPLR